MPDKISHVDTTRSDPSFKISVLGIPPVAIITISGFSDNISSFDANELKLNLTTFMRRAVQQYSDYEAIVYNDRKRSCKTC